ncbi:hypothetical protein DFH09DRAFT_1071666 [Mycena vulgaris]|nr:hypothetical protein DFH09DRAFT_1071666 [Mycena vulgaris]
MAMPRESRTLPDFIIASPDDSKKFKCTICERFTDLIQWIARDSISKHTKSKAHTQNAAQANARFQTAATVEDTNDAIHVELATLEIGTLEVHPAGTTSTGPSAAECDMWDSYNTNGAIFSAGDDPELVFAKERAALAREADEFGLWNAQSMARQLGFSAEGGDPVVDERDEDDAILCEMMDNALTTELYEEPDLAELVDEEMGVPRAKSNSEWYPYPNKMAYNLPRQRVSNSLMRSVPLLARFMMEGRWDDAKVVVDNATLNLGAVTSLNCVSRLVEDETNPALSPAEIEFNKSTSQRCGEVTDAQKNGSRTADQIDATRSQSGAQMILHAGLGFIVGCNMHAVLRSRTYIGGDHLSSDISLSVQQGLQRCVDCITSIGDILNEIKNFKLGEVPRIVLPTRKSGTTPAYIMEDDDWGGIDRGGGQDAGRRLPRAINHVNDYSIGTYWLNIPPVDSS